MKTLIAIPCMNMVPVGFVQSILYLKKGEDVSVLMKPDSLIYDSRNLISLTAIETERGCIFGSGLPFSGE